MSSIVLGIDFGSSSVRVLSLNPENGTVISSVEQAYSEGSMGVLTSNDNIHIARQSAADYLASLKSALKMAGAANAEQGIDMSAVAGIGVDATGSTPIPVAEGMLPLSAMPAFKGNLNAYSWMWKDHSSHKEAEQITDLIKKHRPKYMDRIGGAYSSEWYWAKILHCRNTDKKVFDATDTWIELSDYIPAVLCGVSDNRKVKRNACAAGHKALYSSDWGGFPDREFIEKLHPDLLKISDSLPEEAFSIEHEAGKLCEKWASEFGIKTGIPVAMGIMDAHAGGVGSGIKKGSLVKIIGTSTCDLVLGDLNNPEPGIEGVAGVAKDSVLPGHYGIEAGQSAVGDILNWFINEVLKNSRSHAELTEEASKLKAGESGLLALDWNNGNRNILTDAMLSGLILGQSLHTKDYEIYRALIESTAFGARKIIEHMEAQGVEVNEVLNCGGISHKNPLFMQIYADVIGKPMKIAAIDETVALGAAMAGAYVYYRDKGETITYQDITIRSCRMLDKVYVPNEKSSSIYDKLYVNYIKLHDSFGVKGEAIELYPVMKELIDIKNN